VVPVPTPYPPRPASDRGMLRCGGGIAGMGASADGPPSALAGTALSLRADRKPSSADARRISRSGVMSARQHTAQEGARMREARLLR